MFATNALLMTVWRFSCTVKHTSPIGNYTSLVLTQEISTNICDSLFQVVISRVYHLNAGIGGKINTFASQPLIPSPCAHHLNGVQPQIFSSHDTPLLCTVNNVNVMWSE
jgi:hypothetical protein